MKLDYDRQPTPRRRGWTALLSVLAFIVGLPVGYAIAGGAATLWQRGQHASSPAGWVFLVSLATITAGGFCHRSGRTSVAWFAFGTGCGLAVASFFIELLWGWHGS